MESERIPAPSAAEAAGLLSDARQIHAASSAGVPSAPWFGPALGGGEALIFLGQMLPDLLSTLITVIALVGIGVAGRQQIQLNGLRYRIRDHKALFLTMLVPLLALYTACMVLEETTGRLWPWPPGAVLVFVFLVLTIRRLDTKAVNARTGSPSGTHG